MVPLSLRCWICARCPTYLLDINLNPKNENVDKPSVLSLPDQMLFISNTDKTCVEDAGLSGNAYVCYGLSVLIKKWKTILKVLLVVALWEAAKTCEIFSSIEYLSHIKFECTKASETYLKKIQKLQLLSIHNLFRVDCLIFHDGNG